MLSDPCAAVRGSLRLHVRLWVISGQAVAGQNPPLSAVTPKADKRGYGWIVRFVPSTSATLRLFSYGKFEFQLKESERSLWCGPNGWSAMLPIIASTHNVLRMLAPKQRPPYEEVWHLWTVIIPRRSITGRLLWGTVLRRRDDGRWIYKKYIEGVDPTEYRRSVHKLIVESRKTAPISPKSDQVF